MRLLQGTLPAHLAGLFKHLKALQILSYDHSRIHENRGEAYEPGDLINTLCAYAEKTLPFLNYTSAADDSIGDNRTPYAGTLRSFEALKTLRISRVVLIENRAPQKLVDVLPSLLAELELVGPVSPVEAEGMLKERSR